MALRYIFMLYTFLLNKKEKKKKKKKVNKHTVYTGQFFPNRTNTTIGKNQVFLCYTDCS